MATMDNYVLARILAEFFLDSLREDAGDVDNWCSQGGHAVGERSADDIVDSIKKHLGLSI